MEALVEVFALVESVLGGVNGWKEFDQDFARADFQFSLFHDAVSVGTGNRHQRNAGLDGHHRGSLLEFLQAAVGAARALGINQKTLPALQRFGGFFEANNGGVPIKAVHGDEPGEVESLADNRIFEERALEENGDAAGDGADDGGCVGSTGVIGGEDNRAGGNALNALPLDGARGGVNKKNEALDSST